MSDIKTEFERTVFSLLKENPFYGNLLMLVRRTFTKSEEVPTAAVVLQNPPVLIINENFFLKELGANPDRDQVKKHRMGVLEHEMLHMIMKHDGIRFGEGYSSDANLLNIACDLAINQLINKERLPPKAQTIEAYDLPADKTTEFYYSELKKKRESGMKKIQELLKNGGLNGIPGKTKGCCQPGKAPDAKTSQTDWNAEIDLALRSIIKDAYERAKKDPNGPGNLPGNIKELIERMIAPPKVPWNKEIRQFPSSLGRARIQNTIKRESKRFGTTPGTRIKNAPRILVAIDTSGSISNEDLRLFANEIHHMFRQGTEITIAECDTRINKVYNYQGKLTEVHGRGGTDLNAIFNWIKDTNSIFDGIICLTDGYTIPLPERQPVAIKTLWIINRGEKCANFGKTIHIE